MLAQYGQQWAQWQLNIAAAEPLSPTNTYGSSAAPDFANINGQALFSRSWRGTAANDPFPVTFIVNEWIREKSS